MNIELENLILGEKLGSGVYRDVYIFKPDKTKVIKVAKDNAKSRTENLIASKLYWDNIYLTPFEKWFAKIYDVSDNGKYLIQERTEKYKKEKYPEKIPSFLTDTKYDNFGYIKGKGLVCIDYGCICIARMMTNRMSKVEWWGDEEE